MSKMAEYMNRTSGGMEHFFAVDKIVVLVLAVFFLFWLKEKSEVCKKGNTLLVYALAMSTLLLCPLTAVFGVMYQTAFYDYEWLWSMVPVTIILAYASVLLYDTEENRADRKKGFLSVAVFVLLLFWCGNQGKIPMVNLQEAEVRRIAGSIVTVLEKEALEDDITLWASKDVLQEVRRQTGEVALVYGRDMWEPKAGAYDYETYSAATISAYEWMEDVEDISADTIPRVAKIMWQRENMGERLEMVSTHMLDHGVNTIAVSVSVKELFEDTFFPVAEGRGLTVEEILVEEYILYRLK